MKQAIRIFVLALVLVTVSACTTQNKTGEPNTNPNAGEETSLVDTVALTDGAYEVQTETSVVTWKANKVLAAHTGDVTINSGQLEIVNSQPSQGEFVLDLTTITSHEGIDSLVKHLKSEDFFNVEVYPQARLVVTASRPGDLLNEYILSGDLTIKDITKPVEFRAIVVENTEGLNAQAEIIINRLDWDIKYRSGQFFQDLGDNLISDEVSFVINLNARR